MCLDREEWKGITYDKSNKEKKVIRGIFEGEVEEEAEHWKFYQRRLIDGLCGIRREIWRPCPILITQVGGTVIGRQVCRDEGKGYTATS